MKKLLSVSLALALSMLVSLQASADYEMKCDGETVAKRTITVTDLDQGINFTREISDFTELDEKGDWKVIKYVNDFAVTACDGVCYMEDLDVKSALGGYGEVEIKTPEGIETYDEFGDVMTLPGKKTVTINGETLKGFTPNFASFQLNPRTNNIYYIGSSLISESADKNILEGTVKKCYIMKDGVKLEKDTSNQTSLEDVIGEVQMARLELGKSAAILDSLVPIFKQKDEKIQNNVRALLETFKKSKDAYTRNIGIYFGALVAEE